MTDTSAPDVLSGLSIFAGLSSRQLKKLLAKTRETSHQAGHVIASEGAGALALHVVLEGEAEVSLRGEVLRTLTTGDHFGEISMIDGKPRSATVTATTDLRTLALSHLDFNNLVDDDPTFARALLVALCARLREAENRQA